ncbi:MAG: hypothetical protein M5U09_13560 [Gammaproteobacteria bacterium]|nr:hypothetical protein [Gammaproteobacteria bacterium]
MSRDLGYPLHRGLAVQDIGTWRQLMVAIAAGQAVGSVAGRPVTTSLVMLLTAADRVWLQAQMLALAGGSALRVQPDTGDAWYMDVVLEGEELDVVYERVWEGLDDLWRIELLAVVTAA